jgi:hypothetical protein
MSAQARAQPDTLLPGLPDSLKGIPTAPDSVPKLVRPGKGFPRLQPQPAVPVDSMGVKVLPVQDTLTSAGLPEKKKKEKKERVARADWVPVPKKAALRSAILPGLGQAYNRSYWKIPIFYAGFGGLAFVAIDQNKAYKDFRWAYRVRTDDDETTIDTLFSPFITDGSIKSRRDFHRRNRDLTFILTGVWYALNVVEAYVDAHLKGFDVSEDLSLHIRPAILGTAFRDEKSRPVPGVGITLKGRTK